MNSQGKIAFVVGHSHWGKSTTLRALTNNDFRIRWHSISNTDFFIRRMSNDDYPDSYLDFMTRVNPGKYEHLIATLCPVFGVRENPTSTILGDLKNKGFDLFFWILANEQGPGNRIISKSEIRTLQNYGTASIHEGKSTPKQNARLFHKFVSELVLT
jgi:hypothetical protein